MTCPVALSNKCRWFGRAAGFLTYLCGSANGGQTIKQLAHLVWNVVHQFLGWLRRTSCGASPDLKYLLEL
jgi:hypothetical protein